MFGLLLILILMIWAIFYHPSIKETGDLPTKDVYKRQHPRSSKRFLQFADRHNIWPDAGFKADEVTAESFLIALNTAIIKDVYKRQLESTSRLSFSCCCHRKSWWLIRESSYTSTPKRERS